MDQLEEPVAPKARADEEEEGRENGRTRKSCSIVSPHDLSLTISPTANFQPNFRFQLQEEKKALEMPPMSAPVVPAALDTYGQSYGNLSAAQGFPGSQVYQVGPNSPLFPETAAKASAAAVPSAENALTAVNQTTFTTSINTYTSQAGGSIPSVCGSVEYSFSNEHVSLSKY